VSRDDDNPPAGALAPAESRDKSPANPLANPPVNSPANPADGGFGRRPDTTLRHRVDGDVLRVWPADVREPAPYHTPEMHAVELLFWLGDCYPADRYPAGIWVSAWDIQYRLYPAFLQERGWQAQPMSTVFIHLKKLTGCRTKDMAPRGSGNRDVQVQYEIPKPAAAVVNIEAARKRA
jgi:hypothetical protein